MISVTKVLRGRSFYKVIKVNSFIRGYHMYMTEWEPTMGDVYKLMREPSNIKDSNAVAIVMENLARRKPSELMMFIQIM